MTGEAGHAHSKNNPIGERVKTRESKKKHKRNGVAMRQQHGALYTSKHNNNNNN